MLLFLSTGVVLAEEGETKTIVEFKKMYEVCSSIKWGNEYGILTIKKDYKVPLDELIKEMPASYPVRFEGEEEWVTIPINWECVDDYENGMYGVYVFIPEPVDSRYVISQALGNMDIPAVEVTIDSEIREKLTEIQVKVETPDGQSYILKLDTAENIYKMQVLLEEITGISVEDQMIYFGDVEIKADQDAGEYGIIHGSVLKLESIKNSQEEEPDVETKEEEKIETPEVDNSTENEVEPDEQVQIQKRAVKTGDTAQGVIWVTVFLMALSVIAGMVGLKINKRK